MLLKSILKPTLHNISVWLNTIFLLTLLIIGWADSFTIIMIYFFETIIIGIIQILKIAIVGAYGDKQKGNEHHPLGIILFFIVHYGFFVGIQSIFVFAIFSELDPNIKEAFSVFDNFYYAFNYPGIKPSLVLIFCSLLFQMYFSFIRSYKYHNYNVLQLMFQPYLRIFIQQFVVIISSFFTMFFPNGIFIALILIFFRLFIDLVGIYIGKEKDHKLKFAKFLTKKTPDKEGEVNDHLDVFFD